MRNAAVAMLLAVTGCRSIEPVAPEPLTFEGESAMIFVEEQMAFGARIPGSSASRQAGDMILANLAESGWTTAEQTFDYRGVELRNILALDEGSAGPLIVLGAHYDTRKIADQESTSTTQPVPGANDGGSGVGVLLELARVLPTAPPDCRVQLAFFDGEDNGGLDGWDWIVGSTYMAENLSELPAAVIVVDMVGDEDLDLFLEGNSDRGLRGSIWETARGMGHTAFVPIVKYSMIDDHIPFVRRGIPAVDIIDFDYAHWHTRHDTLDKLSAASLEQVGRTLQSWLGNCPGSLGG